MLFILRPPQQQLPAIEDVAVPVCSLFIDMFGTGTCGTYNKTVIILESS